MFASLLVSLCLRSAASAAPPANGTITGPTRTAGRLVMGQGHVCSLDDGSVACWGFNDDDQLGDGFTGFSAAAIEGPSRFPHGADEERVVEVVAASDSTCVRTSAGRVFCWGAGDSSQAAVDGLADALELTTQGDDVCARRKTGQVVCWNKSDYVTAPLSRNIKAHTAPVHGVVALVAPGEARQRGGRVIHWDLDSHPPCKPSANRACPPAVIPGAATIPEPPLPSLPPTTAVVSGSAHKCALLTDGHVRCWSKRNRQGQAGDGTTLPRPEPVEVVGLDDAVELVAMDNRTCARRRNGKVACWGENHSGEVGASTLRDQPLPVAVEGIDDATHLALGNSHSCALRTSGGFACWGWGQEGQLFDSRLMRTQPWSPITVSAVSGAVELTAGASHSCVRYEDGTVECWGRPRADRRDACHPEIEGIVCPSYGYGSTCGGTIIGHVVTYASPQRIEELRDVIALDARSDRTCAVDKSGRVRCFNRQGPCGGGGETKGSPEDVATVPDAIEIALGGEHDCARTRNGQVSCWGENANGQIGDGTLEKRAAPVSVIGLRDAVQLALGRQHSCALLRDGRVACWGRNVTGQLGTGSREPAQRPMFVTALHDVLEIRAGDWHTCARERDGTVWCWGENDRGSLGDGTTTDRLAPVQVKGLPAAAALAASGFATCARSATGAVSCWGEVAGLPNQERPVLRFTLRATASPPR